MTLNHQRRQELLIMDSEIRHLKKREAFMVTAGGWPITRLIFKIKNYPAMHPALLERDMSEISHQIAMLDKIKDIQMESNFSSSNPTLFDTYIEEEKLDLF